MPKTKTSSSAKKRFKVTGRGKLLRRQDQPVAEANVSALKQMLGKRARRS